MFITFSTECRHCRRLVDKLKKLEAETLAWRSAYAHAEDRMTEMWPQGFQHETPDRILRHVHDSIFGIFRRAGLHKRGKVDVLKMLFAPRKRSAVNA